MNAKNFYSGLLLAGCSLALFSSCEKEVYDATKVQKTSELVVPEGFDWAMTRNVTISMKSPHETSVAIYKDKSCQEKIAVLPVAAGESSITMEMPKANSSIWMGYTLESGKKEVMEVPIQKAATRAAESWSANAVFPDAIYRQNENAGDFGVIFQPAENKFGTIMFEDQWPNKGDYDFNDFVVNYNIKAERINTDYTELTVALKIRAIGGSLPYRFCIQIGRRVDSNTSMNILHEDIKGINSNANFNGGKAELLEADYVIVAINGLEELKGKNGGEFYNTEKAYLDTETVPTITFTLRIDEKRHAESYPYSRSFFSGFGNQLAFDYFLQKTDGSNREIHLIDWAPTELYTTYDKDAGSSMSETKYCSKDRFVWALKGPIEMAWPIERQDISGVYTRFVEWVQKGSNDLEDHLWNIKWYEQNDKNLIKDTRLYIKP